MVRRSVACIALVAWLGWSVPCRADDTAPSAASPETAQASDSLPVTIKLVSTPIQSEAIRQAIEAELKVSVRVADAPVDEGLSVTVKWRRVTVSYRSKQNETTTRSLDLPANKEQAVEVIALLAGNLARDEASELLARLAPPPSEAAAAETTASSGTAVPAEQPPAEKPPEPKPEEKPKPAAKKSAAKKLESDQLIRKPTTAINLSFFHPIALLAQTERRLLNIELGFAYSRVGAVEGVGFTLGYLRVDRHVRGAVGSFGWTRVDGEVQGIQGSTFFSEGHGMLRGAEAGLLGTFRWGDVYGVQGSFLFTMARKVQGAQGSAGVSIASDVQGGQVGLVSVARDMEGGQLALVGVARDIEGGQLGLVNIARSADVQVGLVNVAKRIDGAAIGLVNIAGNGYVEPTAYVIGGSRFSYNAGVKFVAGLVYSVLAGGMGTSTSSATTSTGNPMHFRAEAGLGLHVEPPLLKDGPVVDRTALEVGGHVSSLPTIDESAMHYRAGLGFRFFRALWLLGGYDVNHDLNHFGDNVGQGPWAGIAVF